MISEGFCPGYADNELDRIEEDVAPFARDLAASMEEEVLPKID